MNNNYQSLLISIFLSITVIALILFYTLEVGNKTKFHKILVYLNLESNEVQKHPSFGVNFTKTHESFKQTDQTFKSPSTAVSKLDINFSNKSLERQFYYPSINTSFGFRSDLGINQSNQFMAELDDKANSSFQNRINHKQKRLQSDNIQDSHTNFPNLGISMKNFTVSKLFSKNQVQSSNLAKSDLNVLASNSNRYDIPIAPEDPGVPIGNGLLQILIYIGVYSIIKHMKTIRKLTLIFLLAIAASSMASTYTVGSTGTYTRLSEAINDINSGSITGDIILKITSNITETDSITLNASGNGSSNYNSLIIKPEGGVHTISSTIDGYSFNFYGADNVTIDGIDAIGVGLYLINTSENNNAGVLKFSNDATNNIIKNCHLLSNSSSTSTGIIYFAPSGSTGNSDNLISNCTIGPSSTNYPLVGIYSAGLSSSIQNSNSITYCKIHDISSSLTTTKKSIHLYDYNKNWTISNNSFFNSDSIDFTNETNIVIIHIESGQGSIISGNKIGGTDSDCSGTPMRIKGKIYGFLGINGTNRMSGFDLTDQLNISNNTIQNISIESSSGNNGSIDNPRFAGIRFVKGRVSITDNLIGSNTQNASISINNNSSAYHHVIGIFSGYYNTSSTNYQAYKINNNQISGIRMGSSNSKRAYFRGIEVYQDTKEISEIKNNSVGSRTLTNSIQFTSGMGDSFGYYNNINNQSSTITFKNNVTTNFSIKQISGMNYQFTGITFNPNNCLQTILIDSCEISNIDAKTNSAGNPYIWGMNCYNGNGNPLIIDHLLIYNLKTVTFIQAVVLDGIVSFMNSIIRDLEGNGLYGINFYPYAYNSGMYSSAFVNNLIVLGENNSNDIDMRGMTMYLDDMFGGYSTIIDVDIIQNTFIITGSSSGNSNYTTATDFYGYSYDGNLSATLSNNIFFNNRTSTGDVSQKYMGLQSYSMYNTMSYSDNVYYSANGTAMYNDGNYINSDPNSQPNHSDCSIIDPTFTNLSSNNLDDFRPTIQINGSTNSYTTDLSGEERSDYFSIGALQQIGEFYWNSTGTDDFQTSTNWTDSNIASNNSNITIENSASKNIFLDQNRSFKNINFNSNGNGVKVELGDYDLQLKSVSNYNSNNYIKVMGNGRLSMNVPAGESKVFPIGNENYSPVTVTNNSGADDTFSISLLDSVTNTGLRTGSLLTDFRVRKTIQINKGTSNSGNGYTIKLDWNNSEANNVNNPQFFEYDNTLSTWKKASGTMSSTANSATLTNYTGNGSKLFVGSLEEITWNGTSFTGNTSSPTFFTDLIVNGNNLNTNGLIANNFTVNEGNKVTNSSGNDLILGNLLLKSTDVADAQTIANGSITIAGQTVLEKTLNGDKWYFFSLPFDVTEDRIFKVESGVETTATWGDAFGGAYVAGKDLYIAEYDTQNRDLQSNGSPNFSGGGVYWKNLSTRTIQANKGYIVALDGSTPMTFRFKSATGTSSVNADAVTKTISKSANSAQVVNHSWNLVGNPYLSGFDLKDASNHKPYYLFDGSTYKTIIGDISDTDADRQMQPFTAFFCQAFDASSSVNFSNSGKLFKAPSEVHIPNYQILKIGISGVGSEVVQDAVRFRFGPQFSDEYVLGEDAIKMASTEKSIPQIYTSFQSMDLSINSIPEVLPEIPLQVYVPQQGQFKLNLLLSEYATELGRIKILDKIDNKVVELTENQELLFESPKGINSRFSIVLSPSTVTSLETDHSKGIKLQSINKTLLISGICDETDIRIRDLSGKVLFIENNACSDKSFNLNEAAVVIVEIRNSNQKTIQKIRIN